MPYEKGVTMFENRQVLHLRETTSLKLSFVTCTSTIRVFGFNTQFHEIGKQAIASGTRVHVLLVVTSLFHSTLLGLCNASLIVSG